MGLKGIGKLLTLLGWLVSSQQLLQCFYACSHIDELLNVSITRCTYLRCMPRAHLHDLWTNMCGLVGVACAFGTVGHACATKCEKRIREVEHATFMPLVMSATGGMGRAATTFYKRLASMISEKRNTEYSQTVNWIRCCFLIHCYWQFISFVHALLLAHYVGVYFVLNNVSVWEGRQSVPITLKEFEKWVHFRTTQNAKVWWFLKMTTCFICFARRCCSLTYSSFLTWTYGVEAAFMLCLLLRFRTRLLALSSLLPSQLLPFWRHDNETASAATMGWIGNKRKVRKNLWRLP